MTTGSPATFKDAVVAVRSSDASGEGWRLAIPADWVLAPSTLDRLVHRLARCADVDAIGGRLLDLPPGSSYRVAAEWCSLATPVADTMELSATPRVDVAIVRDGVDAVVSETGVKVDGRCLLDPGVAVHDPWRVYPQLVAASSSGRSPFPRKPLLLVLGSERDPDVADWARVRVNELVQSSTEGRIAVPEPTGGLHLTRPCSPEEATVKALRPAAILALDKGASEVAHGWLGDDRSAVVIEMTPETADRIELVPWRIGAGVGRVRARIGRGVASAQLEALVHRLAAGPQALPPSRHAGPLLVRRRRTAPVPPTVRFLVGERGSASFCRAVALVESGRAAGGNVGLTVVGDGEASDEADHLVVMDPAAPVSEAALRSSRLPAVTVDVRPRQVIAEEGGGMTMPDHVRELVDVAGQAITPLSGLAAELRNGSVRTLVVRTPLREARIAGLVRLRNRRSRPVEPVVGWHLPPVEGDSADPALKLEAVAALRDAVPEVHIVVTGSCSEWTGRRLPDGITVREGPPDPHDAVRWAAQIWDVSPAVAEWCEDTALVAEAHLLGVPTFVPVTCETVAEGLTPSSLVLPGAVGESGWSDPVTALLSDGDRRAEVARDVVLRAEALCGSAGRVASFNRLSGWLRLGAGL